MKKINLDAIHEKWFRMAENFAWEFLGRPTQKWAILNSNKDDSLDVLGTFSMPNKSDRLIFQFARCTQALPNVSEEFLKKIDLDYFPPETFCLPSLLSISYPKCPITEIFRSNVGCVWLGGFFGNDIMAKDILTVFPELSGQITEGFESIEEMKEEQLDQKLINEINAHAAFMGVGVILMNATRKIVDPTETNKGLIKACTNYLVCHVGDKNNA